jgi:hypothetical protein
MKMDSMCVETLQNICRDHKSTPAEMVAKLFFHRRRQCGMKMDEDGVYLGRNTPE